MRAGDPRWKMSDGNNPCVDGAAIKLNYRNRIDGLALLSQLRDASIKTAFFDPQYRGVLDKLSYGNEGVSRGKQRCELTQMSEETIVTFIAEIDRVLEPSGHLFLWIDKFHLCQGVLPWLVGTDLNLVDMVVWDKDRIGMGYRTRRKSEYLVVLQKTPKRAKGVWTKAVKKEHPHSKPLELQTALIEATTDEGDWVLDPASGGYSVFAACQSVNRNFVGGDIEYGED